jgi:hypothetical protein
MAQRTAIELVDDLTGEAIPDGEGQTVAFTFQGVSYEIDLSDDSIAELTDALSPYIESGRRVGGRPSRSRVAAVAKVVPIDTKTVRAWADANGIEVSSRGRLAADVIEQYRAAGKSAAVPGTG